MRVLIICNDFPPLNSIGARRPYSWFRWFNEFGTEPIVITKQWTATLEKPEDVLKNSSTRTTQTEKNDFGTIIRVPVKLIPPEKILLKYGEGNRRVWRKMLTLIYKLFSFCFFSFDKHAGLYYEAKKFLHSEKVDAILISGEPFILFRYGFLLHKEFGIPWVADYRDGWKLNHVTRFNSDIVNRFMQRWEFQFEKKYLKNCIAITAPDPYLGDALGKLHNLKWKAIYNGFEEFQPGQTSNQTSALILTHTGTLTAGQRVEFLLEAVSELHNEKKIQPADLQLNFIGLEYYSAQNMRVKNFSSAITEYIKTTPRISQDEALALNAKSDFLIAFTEENYEAIFAKVYDYLAVKKTILVLPNDHGLLNNLMNETGAGISFEQLNEFKTFLLDQIQKKKAAENLFAISPKDDKVLFYTRRKQAEQLIQFLKETIVK